ncbi:MAG: PilZ domain-containing protein [Desulfobacteraceae bacterium]|nr:PilZ domain-containing protein [Desulfobacteraceae bacterium]
MFESAKKRLSEFFKTSSSDAGSRLRRKQEPAGSEQRGFDRYSVGFPVIISGNDADSAPFEEKSRLQDVSGSGAMFLTKYPARYYPGQFLQLSILLDASKDVQARINNEANVVRIHHQEPGFPDSSRQAGIAVSFSRAFDFQRIDPDSSGHSE